MDFFLANHLYLVYLLACAGLCLLAFATSTNAFSAALIVTVHWVGYNYHYFISDFFTGYDVQLFELVLAWFCLWLWAQTKYSFFIVLSVCLMVRTLWHGAYELIEFERLLYTWVNGLIYLVVEILGCVVVCLRELKDRRVSPAPE